MDPVSPAKAPRRSRIMGWAVASVLTISLVLGSVAIAGSVSGVLERVGLRGSATAPTGDDLHPRRSLELRAKVKGGPLVPGIRRTLKVTVVNPLNQRVKVTAVSVTAKRPQAAGCKPSWVRVSSFHAGKNKPPLVVKPGRKKSLKLHIKLKNLPSVNQDACKSTRFPLKIRASARQG